MRNFLLIPGLAAMLLTACTSDPPRFDHRHAEFGPGREKEMFFALKAVKADEAQRSAVLAAFDASDPRLKALSGESASVTSRLKLLDARQPDYLASAEPLTHRQGEIDSEKLLIQAQFSQTVAANLTAEQWHRWNTLFEQSLGEPEPGDSPTEAGAGGGHPRGRRRY